MDWHELDEYITRLESSVRKTDGDRPQFRSIWDEIKKIGTYFKETRYPSKEQRQAAWLRFQASVDMLKDFQDKYFTKIKQQTKEESENYKYKILAKAEAATPSNYGDLIYGLIPPLGLAKMVWDKLLPGPPIDEEKEQLERCSAQLKAGWRLMSEHKADMTKADKDEAFQSLKKAEERLQQAWDHWKSSRNEVREAKREAWEAKQEERRTKRDDFEKRLKENIRRNEEKLEKANDALTRKEQHVEDLQDQARSAWSDGYRSRVEGWIAEEEDRISDIKANAREVEGWIEEAQERLDNIE